MPLNNLGKTHITTAQKTAISAAFNNIIAELTTVTQNLSEEERRKYGSVNEQNKLVVNKVNDFHNTQPALQSPDVEWTEFDLDFADRSFADTHLGTLNTVFRMLSDFKIAHDYDNYQDSLTDYAYSQYKAGTNTPGYTAKVTAIKQFFPNTGGGGTNSGSTPA